MPIHWRRFYFNKLLESKKNEKAEMEKSQKTGTTKGPNVRVRK